MKFIPYTDSAFRFSGVWQENQQNEIASYKTSAMAEVGFTGQEIVLVCSGKDNVKLFIDDTETEAEKTDKGYLLRTSKGKHTLKLTVRSDNRIYIKGVEICDNESVFLPKAKPYIQFIGDSITEAAKSYAVVCPKILGVDYSIVSKGGMAVCDGFGWYGIPEHPGGDEKRKGMESMYFKLAETGYDEDIGNYNFKYCRTPNLIVMLLGTNDYLNSQAHEKSGNLEKFSKHYSSFILKIREIFPQTPIYVLQALTDSHCRRRGIEAAFDIAKKQTDNITLVDSDKWNVEIADGTHPTENGYAFMGEKLAGYIKEQMPELLNY